ncbi:cytochrome P450 4C1-like isoform X2 [Anticarsia gemmatalis]
MELGRAYAKKYNGIYSIWIFPYSAVIVYNPDDIETLMSNMKYADKSIAYKFLEPWLREGLLTSNGAKWQERRKILTPAFHFNILKQYSEIIQENCDRFVENLQKRAGKPIDVLPAFSEFTLNSICETAMGTQLNKDTTGTAKSYKKALYDIGFLMFSRFVRVYLYPDFIFYLTPWGRQQRKHLKTIHSFTENVIEQRKQYVKKNGVTFDTLVDDNDFYVYKKKKKTAMLDLLISAEKEGLIDKTGIQEEVDTFMFEGHDTTASGLTFCLMRIANHSKIQEKIRDEITEVFGDSKDSIKMEDMNKLKYTECVIKESLRMYPPVHFISRNINEDTILSNYTVPAGTLCHIPIFDLHYREDIYKNPHEFDPDRFLPENSVGRHPYGYIPFSAGLRNCIGQKFAMMEMKIAITKILQEFILEPVTRPEDIRFVADLVLRNNGPVLVNFIKRQP